MCARATDVAQCSRGVSVGTGEGEALWLCGATELFPTVPIDGGSSGEGDFLIGADLGQRRGKLIESVDGAFVGDSVRQVPNPPAGAHPLAERQPTHVADHQDPACAPGGDRREPQLAAVALTRPQTPARRPGMAVTEQRFDGVRIEDEDRCLERLVVGPRRRGWPGDSASPARSRRPSARWAAVAHRNSVTSVCRSNRFRNARKPAVNRHRRIAGYLNRQHNLTTRVKRSPRRRRSPGLFLARTRKSAATQAKWRPDGPQRRLRRPARHPVTVSRLSCRGPRRRVRVPGLADARGYAMTSRNSLTPRRSRRAHRYVRIECPPCSRCGMRCFDPPAVAHRPSRPAVAPAPSCPPHRKVCRSSWTPPSSPPRARPDAPPPCLRGQRSSRSSARQYLIVFKRHCVILRIPHF